MGWKSAPILPAPPADTAVRAVCFRCKSVFEAAGSEQTVCKRCLKTLWATPPEFFQRLDRIFRFTLDVCAQHHTTKCRRYFVHPVDCTTCGGLGTYLEAPCLDCDGLRQSWAGERWWGNFPYGAGMVPWLEKAVTEQEAGTFGVALLPHDSSTRWYHDLVKPYADVKPVEGRIRFVGASNSPDFASILAIYWPRGIWKGGR